MPDGQACKTSIGGFVRMRSLCYIFALHVILLTLASSNFTVVSFVRDDVSLSWNYFTYSYRSGFGYEYVSEYSPAQVLAYLAAYGVGLVFFLQVYRKICAILGGIGAVLCVVGLISFGIEGSHWIWSHHLSLIGSFPVVLVLLWVVTGAKMGLMARGGPVEAPGGPDEGQQASGG